MDKEKVLFLVFATNNYWQFVPYYIYSTYYFNHMYNIHFLVFVSKGNSSNLDHLVRLMPELNMKIVEMDDKRMDEIARGYTFVRYYRWLLPKEYYEEYDYAIVGDVDMLTATDVISVRLEHMKTYSYFNFLRRKHDRYNGILRFRGVHSFKTKEYIERYYKDIQELTFEKILELKITNEQALFYVLKNHEEYNSTKKLRPPCDINGGLHLGSFRKMKKGDKFSNYANETILNGVKKLVKDEKFLDIHKIYNHHCVTFVINNIDKN